MVHILNKIPRQVNQDFLKIKRLHIKHLSMTLSLKKIKQYRIQPTITLIKIVYYVPKYVT